MKKIKYLIYGLVLSIPYKVLAAPRKPVSCGAEGGNYLTKIPAKIPELTSLVFNILQVAVPVIIVIFGSIDLIKAITAGKEDEIKKAQSVVIKRLITGVLVFFLFVIVKLLIRVVNGSSTGIINCMNCFINNSCVYK